MSALLFAFLSVLLVGLGARDQTLLAAMAVHHRQRPALVLTASISAIGACLIAVWAGHAIAETLSGPARQLFAAIALGLAGIEMIAARQTFVPREPTHSLGALALVLFARQIADAARFLLVGIAVATHAPIPAAMGGSAAAASLALGGWLAADDLASRDLSRPRRAIGLALLIIAIALAARTLR